jgi:hypothetical protein
MSFGNMKWTLLEEEEMIAPSIHNLLYEFVAYCTFVLFLDCFYVLMIIDWNVYIDDRLSMEDAKWW